MPSTAHSRLGLLAAVGTLSAIAAPASALNIVTTFDSSITSMANASQIMTAFNSVVSNYASSFTNPATVNLTVSWGSVDGQSLPSNALGASVDPLYGYYSYAQIRGALAATAAANPSDTALTTAVAHLPAKAPSGVGLYAVPSAEAKALGLVSGDLADPDGFVGFSGPTTNYTFCPAPCSVTAGTYDFMGVAAHEISEVLGTISGLSAPNATFRTPFDLFRYKSRGTIGFNYNQAAYFSIDGGATSLDTFNTSASGGDRGDWKGGATTSDDRDAFMSSGRRYRMTNVDLTTLDVLGWFGANAGDTGAGNPGGSAFSESVAVPEPAGWALMIGGLGLAGAALRRRAGGPARA